MKGYEMKRFWLFFCALWGLSWLFPVNAIEFKVNGLTYEVLSEEERTVSIIRAADGVDEIPSVVTWEDVSYTVVAIGNRAFAYHHGSYDLRIPETITEIGDDAFCASSVEVIWLPESITVIGDNAFAYAGPVCSKIRVPQNVVLGKDVFIFTDLWVPKEYEESYLNDSTWNRYSIGGYINEGGLAYCLYEESVYKRADVFLFYDNGDYAFPSGNMVIPSSIEYNDSVYQIYNVTLISDCPDVLHIEAYCHCPMDVYNFSNLMDIRSHYGIHIDNCASLRSIEIVESEDTYFEVTECPLLDSVVFRKRIYDVSYMDFFMDSDAPCNVYFPFNIPPVVASDEIVNRNLVVHIPKGAKEAYMESAWNACGIVDDLPEVTDVVEWGYSERGVIFGNGLAVGNGDNDVEFAMRVPKEYLQAYKGAKITKINFGTSYYSINHDNTDYGENVEYVFVARRGTNEYLAKVPVTVVRGTWMEIPLPEPLLIDGEELMVGIGRHGVLQATWANSYYSSDDGMWLRVMGDDWGGYVPGRWVQNAGQVDWNRPLPITFTIEGENLPQDIATLRMQVERNQGEVTKSSRTERMDGKAKNMAVKDEGEAFYGAYEIVCTGDSIERFSVSKPDMAARGRSVRSASLQDGQTLSAKVKMTVQNRTPRKISSFRIVGTGDEGVVLDTVMHHTLMVNQTKEVEVELVPSVGHRYQKIDLSIAEVDGISDEIPCNSDTTILFISPVQQPYDRKVVVEAAVATWCGWSVRGLQEIEEMEERFPDNFIGIMTHYNDEMAPDESYSAIFDYFGGSTPRFIVNRKDDCITNVSIDPFVLAEMGDADAEISVQAYLMGGDSRKVRACTTTRFGYDANDNYCKIAYVVLENGVGPYVQRNYYSGGTNGYVEGWSEKPSSVSTLYDNVARGIIEYGGVEGSTPMMVKTDEAYQYEYVFDLPSNVEHMENVEIVALLIDGYTGEILNADRTKLVEDPTGIHDVNIGNEGHVKFYVCDGRIVPNMDCELFVYTMDGKAVVNRKLSAGLYIVKAVCNGNVTTCKMAVE